MLANDCFWKSYVSTSLPVKDLEDSAWNTSNCCYKVIGRTRLLATSFAVRPSFSPRTVRSSQETNEPSIQLFDHAVPNFPQVVDRDPYDMARFDGVGSITRKGFLVCRLVSCIPCVLDHTRPGRVSNFFDRQLQ